MAALLPLAALAKAPPHDAKTLTMDPPRIVREKAMHRHEQAGKKDDKWPPDGKSRKFYKALKELADLTSQLEALQVRRRGGAEEGQVALEEERRELVARLRVCAGGEASA